MSDPCVQGERLATLEHQDKAVNDALSRLETKIDLMAIQLSKVSILEERHVTQGGAVDRAFVAIGKIETKQGSHDRFIWMTTGGAIAVSVMWTLFGGWLLSQTTSTMQAVAEMKVHIATDKVTTREDVQEGGANNDKPGR